MAHDRRSFLRQAGMTIATALTARSVEAVPLQSLRDNPSTGRFDFDTLPNRIGTDSTKWDQQIKLYGRDHVDVEWVSPTWTSLLRPASRGRCWSGFSATTGAT